MVARKQITTDEFSREGSAGTLRDESTHKSFLRLVNSSQERLPFLSTSVPPFHMGMAL